MTYIVLLISLIIVTFSTYFFGYRNQKVYNYRTKLLNSVSSKIREDLGSNNGLWRYDEFEKITYDEMVWKFWIPVDKFYDLDKLLK